MYKLRVRDVLLGSVGGVCILLNNHFKDVYRPIWNNSNERYCTDGAANLLDVNDIQMMPDHVIGDMDSVDKGVLEYFSEAGVKISEESCQDTTDFEKSLNLYARTHSQEERRDIVVLSAFHGRFDHEIAVFHAAQRYMRESGNGTVFLVSPGNTGIILRPGECRLDFSGFEECRVVCGVLPLFGPSHVKTKGLKWDLDYEIEMGSRISSSNLVIAKEVAIETSEYTVFWANIPSEDRESK